MKTVVDFVRDPAFEKRWNFNPAIDYIALMDEYNSLVKAKDREAVRQFITEQGGYVEFGMKYQYQVGMRSGKVAIVDMADWRCDSV